MRRKLLSTLILFIIAAITLAGCKTQSDRSAMEEAHGVARMDVRLYMKHDSAQLSQQIAQALIEQGVTEANREDLAHAIERWIEGKPDIHEIGLKDYIDAFNFTTGAMELDGITFNDKVTLSFIVLVPVDDRNVVADSAMSIKPFVRVGGESFELEMILFE